MKKVKLKITADGSHTLYVEGLDETYHSVHGAIQEALHVYIKGGLNYFHNKAQINVLEIGFGTGLNTFLTFQESTNNKIHVNYTAIEAYPVDIELIGQLNYLRELKVTKAEKAVFYELHNSEWGRGVNINSSFQFTKLHSGIEEYVPQQKFDVIYFDAFGPRVQPGMWTKSIFEIMHASLVKNGILVTYCAKGSVKRTLKEIGFLVENIPGPPGKREMTRAIK